MTDERLEEFYEFYKELRETQVCVQFLKNAWSFGLKSGTIYCELPKRLQEKIRMVILNHYEELEEKLKEL